MNTPTHVLFNAAILARPGARRRNTAVLAGTILPDLAIYVLWAYGTLTGIAEATIWSDYYFSSHWQFAVKLGNSVPLYAAMFIAGLLLRQQLLWLFGAAALLHIGLDFPVHADDAHAHFWPLSDWRFHSTLSYWDSEHYGNTVRIVEFVLACGLAGVLWQRFEGRYTRALLIMALGLYLIVPVYFKLMI